jgi:hypothetical protein
VSGKGERQLPLCADIVEKVGVAIDLKSDSLLL